MGERKSLKAANYKQEEKNGIETKGMRCKEWIRWRRYDKEKANMNIMTLFTFLGRFGSNEEDLRRYEERIATLKQQLSQEKERNEELKTKVGDGSRASQDELRASQTEKTRLQREVRHARGSDGRGIVGSVTHQPKCFSGCTPDYRNDVRQLPITGTGRGKPAPIARPEAMCPVSISGC